MKSADRILFATFLLLASSTSPLLSEYLTEHTLIMGSAEAKSGETVTIPLSLHSILPVEGFTFGIIYNGAQLELVSVTPVAPAGSGWDVFELHRIDRDNAVFWRDDAYGTVVLSEGAAYPANQVHEVLLLEFKALESAEPGFQDVRVRDLHVDPDAPSVDWQNTVISGGESHAALCIEARCQGGISIDPPPPIPFLRGDVNADGEVSISDAAMLRRSIFFDGSSGTFECEDSADVDDSGHVNLTDAIRLMLHVITGPPSESLVAPPYPEAGLDPTPDATHCLSYAPVPPAETSDLVRLESLEAAPGEEVEVPIHVSSAFDVEAYQLVLSYDPTVFTPSGRGVDLSGTALDGRDKLSFNGMNALGEGLIVIGLVGNLVEDGFEIPSGQDVLAGKLRGTISETATPGTEVRIFLTNGPDEEGVGEKRIRNELTHEGEARLVTVIPRLEGMVLGIVSDVTFFRGDSNDDSKLDLSDAVHTLNHLFVGETAPACPDAADADDSGVIDISDPILTLAYLFQGAYAPASPHPRRGRDREPDALPECRP